MKTSLHIIDNFLETQYKIVRTEIIESIGNQMSIREIRHTKKAAVC